jgi:hypothetical protein
MGSTVSTWVESYSKFGLKILMLVFEGELENFASFVLEGTLLALIDDIAVLDISLGDTIFLATTAVGLGDAKFLLTLTVLPIGLDSTESGPVFMPLVDPITLMTFAGILLI